MDLVNELEKYYRTIQPGDLLGKYVLKTFKRSTAEADDPVLQKLNELLVHSGDRTGSGLLTFREIVQSLRNIFSGADIQQLHDRVKVFHDEVLSLPEAEQAYFNDSGKRFTMGSILKLDGSDQNSKRFGVVMSSAPMVSLPVRDVNRVSLFLNTIPTIEMSRSSPYVEINFQFRRAETDTEVLRSPSLLKFLNGGLEISKAGSADKAMFKASIDEETGPGGEKKIVSTAGMELLTAPQTLFNPISLEGQAARRFAPVIDAFRPFMSLDSFEVTAAPSVGMFSYKTARLTLILHDRSRLAEISDFVRPEVYTNTTLSISYGWKHPDGINSDNVYGDLMNQMVVKNEKYGIVNASFSFDAAQQVHVTLQLAMKGMQEMRVVKISEGKDYADSTREMQKLMEDVSKLREKAGLKKPEFVNKEIRAYQILDAVSNGEVLTGFKDSEVKALIDQLKKNPNADAASKLADSLKKIFSTTDGYLEKQNKTIKAFIKGKFDKLLEGPDPFLDADVYADEIEKNLQDDFNSGDLKRPKRVVSLAKLMLIFAVEPMLNSPNFDEIQLVFYQFNSQAGKARDTCIGSFPIEISYLQEVFEDHVNAKRNVDMTINEFILLLQSSIINDPRAIAYGLRQSYAKRKTGKEPELLANAKIEDVLAKALGSQGGTFKYPAVEAYVETRGGRVLKNDERGQEKSKNDILRIHIFDKQASPHDQFMQLIRTQTGLQDIVEKSDKTPNKQSIRDLVNLIRFDNAGLQFEDNPKTSAVRVKAASADAVRQVVSAALPTIFYGTNNSAVITANLQTQQNQLLSTVQMLRTAGRQNNTEPNGSAVGGIPLRVIPCQLDMETLGCPLLNINQQFYIDFSTGTTADNIYLLTHLEHKFKQGSFTSHMKFVPLDAYGAIESIISKVEQISNILKEDATKLSK